MKHFSTSLALCLLSVLCATAQISDIDKYHRSSLYSILLKHPEKEFCDEMVTAFKSIPIPDKYNDHTLKINIMPSPVLQSLSNDEREGAFKESITKLLEKNKIGRRVVEKWFNRDRKSGCFDMNLVAERGYYDATVQDVKKALATVRGTAMLADAGEELINHTYILVNDIRYADKELTKSIINGALGLASVAGSFFGVPLSLVTAAGGELTGKIAGFKVLVTSYLYKLEWDEETAMSFYNEFYMDDTSADDVRKKAFEASDLFRLKYIGSATVFSGQTSLAGVKEEKDMFLKVCTRAVDKSIAELQKSFDEFKVKAPLVTTNPLTAYIGQKEGMTEDSRYEVLEKSMTPDGRTIYERVGIIKPNKGQIWDNRYMAIDDKFEGSELSYTTFQKVSGSDFAPGMLIREIK